MQLQTLKIEYNTSSKIVINTSNSILMIGSEINPALYGLYIT